MFEIHRTKLIWLWTLRSVNFIILIKGPDGKQINHQLFIKKIDMMFSHKELFIQKKVPKLWIFS